FRTPRRADRHRSGAGEGPGGGTAAERRPRDARRQARVAPVRLFIAAYPPGEVLAHFKALVSALWLAQPQPLGRSLRFEPPERWHITLAFLGEVPDARAVDAAAALPRGGPPVRLSIAGGGRFGEGRYTVVWAG